MTEELRNKKLLEHCDWLTSLSLNGANAAHRDQIIHDIKKYVALVAERDAGPTLEAKSTIRALEEEKVVLKSQVEELPEALSKITTLQEQVGTLQEESKIAEAEHQFLQDEKAELSAKVEELYLKIENITAPPVPAPEEEEPAPAPEKE